MNPNNVVGTPNVQAQPVQPEPNLMAMGPTKPGKGGAIAAVLFAILAVAGIGFGVWAMLDSKAQKDALNEQITTLKEQNNELRDKIAELEESCEGSGTKCGNEDTSGYIYVNEWGIKIKNSSDLKYNFDEEGWVNVTDAPTYPFDDNEYNGIQVERRAVGGFEQCTASCPKYITTIDGYDYGVYVYSNVMDTYDDLENSVEFGDFFNPESYSAI